MSFGKQKTKQKNNNKKNFYENLNSLEKEHIQSRSTGFQGVLFVLLLGFIYCYDFKLCNYLELNLVDNLSGYL